MNPGDTILPLQSMTVTLVPKGAGSIAASMRPIKFPEMRRSAFRGSIRSIWPDEPNEGNRSVPFFNRIEDAMTIACFFDRFSLYSHVDFKRDALVYKFVSMLSEQRWKFVVRQVEYLSPETVRLTRAVKFVSQRYLDPVNTFVELYQDVLSR
jgi:hypothetical protein